MALRIERLIRRFLPAAVRLLRPSPHRPLRPFDQRRQSPRQFCQIALVRGRFVVLHDTLPDENGGGELITAARRRRLFTTESRRPALRGSASPDQVQAPDPQQPAPPRQAALLPQPAALQPAAAAALLQRIA